MLKRIYFCAIFLAGSLFFAFAANCSAATQGDVNNLPKGDLYKAIVKIKTYTLNESYYLEEYGEGSGVIIDPSGLVLTNYHVVAIEDDFDDSLEKAVYQVCVPTSISVEPSCNYLGQLIAMDKDLDIALLKIKPIQGLGSETNFTYLDPLTQFDDLVVNEEVIALGYPSIGGNTLTITKGVISGLPEEHGVKWIKTDTLTSYGSSGGAAINKDGKLIGITTQAYSDLLGTMGYATNILSLNNWIGPNKSKPAQVSTLENDLVNYVKEKKQLETADKYISQNPPFTVTKPAGWIFDYNSKDKISIYNSNDSDGGEVKITIIDYPMITTPDDIMAEISALYLSLGMLSEIKITKNEDININGLKGKKITLSVGGKAQTVYYLLNNNYIMEIVYNNGKGDKDEQKITDIINSISPAPDIAYSFQEVHTYSQTNPSFSINTDNNWAIEKSNSQFFPISISSKNNRGIGIIFKLAKTADETRTYTTEDILNENLDAIKTVNKGLKAMGLELDILDSNPHYKLSNDLKNVGRLEGAFKDAEGDKVYAFLTDYFIKIGNDYILNVSVIALNQTADQYNAFKPQIEKMFSGLTVENVSDNKEYPQTPKAPVQATPPAKATTTPPKSTTSTSQQQTNIENEINIDNKKLYPNLKGKIVLEVEKNGEAWYISPGKMEMFYLGRPQDAFNIMRQQGVGITNDDLTKIPVGFTSVIGPDSDKDQLADSLEDALGTDKNKPDSDNDAYGDKQEISGNYNPNGAGKTKIDLKFSNAQKGKILLQVENNGEAWYVNPADGKRYFLGRPSDAYAVMRELGLGISNTNFNSL